VTPSVIEADQGSATLQSAEPTEPDQVEVAARAAWDRGDYAETTRIVFEGYGTELYSFVLASFDRQSAQAGDAFSLFSEDFWRSLPQFQWRCSLRAWCYKLARNAAHRSRRALYRQRARRAPLVEGQAWIDDLVDLTRTRTELYLRSEVKNQVRVLRERLKREDQDLLILRVDRGLAWRDIAHAMLPPDRSDDESVRRLEVALRRRFSEVKARLRRLATEAGLLP